MVRKTVVLCEGEHDAILISAVLDKAGKSCRPMSWSQIESYSRSNPESVLIKVFKSRKCRGISFLIKQDKNIDFCIESFWGLYQGYDGYDLKLVADSDGESGIRKVRRKMSDMLRKDVLQESVSMQNVLCFKNADMMPAVFLYPKVDLHRTGKLTEIVRDSGFGNLAGCRNHDEKCEMINRFVDAKPDWIKELERFLID